jgi:hypothetical protein
MFTEVARADALSAMAGVESSLAHVAPCFRHFRVIPGGHVALVGCFHLVLDTLAELLRRAGDVIELAHDLAHALEAILVGHRRGILASVTTQCQ